VGGRGSHLFDQDLNNLLSVHLVINYLEGDRIPCLCIFYSYAITLMDAETLGSFLISFREPLLSYHDIFLIQLVVWIL
jgi:hypothetical protein